jgi:hypothetical protein
MAIDNDLTTSSCAICTTMVRSTEFAELVLHRREDCMGVLEIKKAEDAPMEVVREENKMEKEKEPEIMDRIRSVLGRTLP